MAVEVIEVIDPIGFEFNKEYVLQQLEHKDKYAHNNQRLNDCLATVKILLGKDTVCE